MYSVNWSETLVITVSGPDILVEGRRVASVGDALATDGDVLFDETKEGTFGVRVPTEMDVDHKPTGGKIVTSEGKTSAKKDLSRLRLLAVASDTLPASSMLRVRACWA